jgi:hypothetical protein
VPPVQPLPVATTNIEVAPMALVQLEGDVSSVAGRAPEPWVVRP